MTTAGGRPRRGIGLAVVGCGKIGRIRAEFARKTPAVEWLGVCDIDERVGRKLAEDVSADFFTKDYRELLRRPDRKSTRLNSSHSRASRMPSSA